jgi:hypothetical protein
VRVATTPYVNRGVKSKKLLLSLMVFQSLARNLRLASKLDLLSTKFMIVTI